MLKLLDKLKRFVALLKGDDDAMGQQLWVYVWDLLVPVGGDFYDLLLYILINN